MKTNNWLLGWLLSLMVTAGANAQNSQTFWGVSDSFTSTAEADIFAWNAYDGAEIQAPVSVNTITGDSRVAHTLGLAVAGDVAWVTYRDAAFANSSILTIDLSNMSLIADTPVDRNYRGLHWDGTTLWAGSTDDDSVYAIGLTDAVPNGTDTQGADIDGDYQYWSALPGTRPTDDSMWAHADQENYKVGDFASGTLAQQLEKVSVDQPGSEAWREDGALLHSQVIDGPYNIISIDLSDKFAASSLLYNLESVNSWDLADVGGVYGMSPVGPAAPLAAVPEPSALLIWLLLMGIAALTLAGKRFRFRQRR